MMMLIYYYMYMKFLMKFWRKASSKLKRKIALSPTIYPLSLFVSGLQGSSSEMNKDIQKTEFRHFCGCEMLGLQQDVWDQRKRRQSHSPRKILWTKGLLGLQHQVLVDTVLFMEWCLFQNKVERNIDNFEL